MMTDPATAIKRQVFQLVELQIEILRQEGRLSDSALTETLARRKSRNSTTRLTVWFEHASIGDQPARRRFTGSRGQGRRCKRDDFRCTDARDSRVWCFDVVARMSEVQSLSSRICHPEPFWPRPR